MKPMLAAKVARENIDRIIYPIMGSPKIDGIRALVGVPNHGTITRSLKQVPNSFVNTQLAWLAEAIPGFVFDGELTCGTFNSTQSAIMSFGGRPSFMYHIFDLVSSARHTAVSRYNTLCDLEDRLSKISFCKVVEQELLVDRAALEAYYAKCLSEGHEGICLRSLQGQYKYGRSTFNQQWLLKMKILDSCEAEIVGFEQFLHNANEPLINELGYQERPSHRHGMQALDKLGAFIVRATNGQFEGVEFRVGSGFSQLDRDRFWFTRDKLRGKIVTVEYQGFGSKNAPRQPIFKGFRAEFDLPMPEITTNERDDVL